MNAAEAIPPPPTEEAAQKADDKKAPEVLPEPAHDAAAQEADDKKAPEVLPPHTAEEVLPPRSDKLTKLHLHKHEEVLPPKNDKPTEADAMQSCKYEQVSTEAEPCTSMYAELLARHPEAAEWPEWRRKDCHWTGHFCYVEKADDKKAA